MQKRKYLPKLVGGEHVGALVHDFDEADYAKAWGVIEDLAGHQDQIRRRTREVARRLFDVRGIGAVRYARLYLEVLDSPN